MINYNDQQIDAIKRSIEWYYTKTHKQLIFAVGGLAGCGKTTIAKIIIVMLGIPEESVIFVTLTGKASLVLRLKGNKSNTIHKTFYSVYKAKRTLRFALKKKINSGIKLIVVDEMSMVNQKMINDISSFNIPIIGLLDPGQLSPIYGSNIYQANPNKLDVFLTQVMRQDDKSGILYYAMLAREHKPLPYGVKGDSCVTTLEKIWDKIHEYDMVLCWKNSTRRKFNALIRKRLGYESVYPKKGEKVLCLRNNYNYGIVYEDIPIYLINGLQGIVISDSYVENTNDLDLLHFSFVPDFIKNGSMDMGSNSFEVCCFQEIFDQYNINIEKDAFIERLCDDSIDDEVLGDVAMMDYGYCLTTHKSQGSEWDSVLVLNEFKGGDNDYARWLYTSITRAKKSVTIVQL